MRRSPRTETAYSSAKKAGKPTQSQPSFDKEVKQSVRTSDLTPEEIRRRRIRAKKRQIAKKKRQRKLILLFAAALSIIAIVVVICIAAGISVPDVSALKISSTTNSQTISWKKADEGVTYEIYQKDPETGEFTLVASVSDITSYTFDNLPGAEFNEYKILAVKGQGEKAKRSGGKTISAYTIPANIEGYSATTQSKNSLTVSWTGRDDVNGYELKYADNEAFDGENTITLTPEELTYNSESNTLNYILNDIPEGTTMYFSMRCFCDKDSFSEWTDVFYGKVIRAIDMTGIDPNLPMIAITYDDGPAPGDVTNRILDAFAAVGGHATFFQLGNRCESYPEQALRIVNEGHELGNHTYDHTHMGDTVTTDDIVSCSNSIEAVTGVRPTVFRSTGGGTTDFIMSVCASEGMSLYYWSVDTRDWSSRDADAVIAEIQASTQDGSIILMHNIYDSTAEATERILPWLVEQGYQLVTVSQLIQAKTGAPPEAGVQYRAGY